jgi:hypothetical protein
MAGEWAAVMFFPHGLMALITAAVTALAVGVHYEGLSLVSQAVLARLPHRARPRIMALVLAVLVIHVLEIWLFGLTYFWSLQLDAFGQLKAVEAGMRMESLPDYAYFSAMVYTTVGFGDIVPDGPVRLLVGAQAITGLVLITWTASYTFLEMQRFWGE